MAEITAQAVNEFRKRTGLGLMECKALLKEADGDLKKAETLAKERGKTKAEGRSGRVASAGRVEVFVAPDHRSGALIELNCETDFVARNDEFRQAAKDLAEHVFTVGDADLHGSKFTKTPDKTVAEALIELNSRTGENVSFHRAAKFQCPGPGRVDYYIHHDGKQGAMVQVDAADDAQADSEAVKALVKDLALQVVAEKHVICVDRSEVPASSVEEQTRIFAAQVPADKPEQIRQKIAVGKLEAWYGEVALLDRPLLKDPSKKVREAVAAAGKGVTLARFARYIVGDAAEA